jgi:hypothetical protein
MTLSYIWLPLHKSTEKNNSGFIELLPRSGKVDPIMTKQIIFDMFRHFLDFVEKQQTDKDNNGIRESNALSHSLTG